MRILQINASYKPAYIYGGPTMSSSKLSERLALAGNEVHVYTTTANGDTELDVTAGEPTNVDGVMVTYFPRMVKGNVHFSPALLAALWKDCKQFDVIHIHAWWNLVSVLGCLIALWRGGKVVLSPRGNLSSYSFGHRRSFIKKIMHRLFSRPVLKKVYLHVTTLQEQRSLEKVMFPKRKFVIPNYVAFPEDLPKRLGFDTEKLHLIFLSRIDSKKGLDILFEALVRVTRPYHLSIVGKGETSYINTLKRRSEILGIQNYITWMGFQQEGKFDLLANSQLMVLTSYDENFGNVVIESLSVGTPVLISEGVGLADYVASKKTGSVCSLQPEDIADKINSISMQQLEAISKISPTIIRSDFKESQLDLRYMDMYKQIHHDRL